MQTLKRIYALVQEYSKYNHHAEIPERFWNRTRISPWTPFSRSITPLVIACLNDKIPVYMIEFLLKKGANLQVPCKASRQIFFLK